MLWEKLIFLILIFECGVLRDEVKETQNTNAEETKQINKALHLKIQSTKTDKSKYSKQTDFS